MRILNVSIARLKVSVVCEKDTAPWRLSKHGMTAPQKVVRVSSEDKMLERASFSSLNKQVVSSVPLMAPREGRRLRVVELVGGGCDELNLLLPCLGSSVMSSGANSSGCHCFSSQHGLPANACVNAFQRFHGTPWHCTAVSALTVPYASAGCGGGAAYTSIATSRAFHRCANRGMSDGTCGLEFDTSSPSPVPASVPPPGLTLFESLCVCAVESFERGHSAQWRPWWSK